MKKKICVTILLLIIVVFVAWYGYRENVKKWDFWPQREMIMPGEK
jgi:hypothetical protein